MTSRLTILCVIFSALASQLAARESVCLRSGFCLEVESHTVAGEIVTFRTGGGTMEFPASEVKEIQRLLEAPVTTQRLIAQEAAAPEKITGQSTGDLLASAATSQGLEPEFVRSVAKVESGMSQKAVSNKGAVGLMQLMPGTAAVLGVNANIAEENAQGGAKFLRALLLRYHGDTALALAAYNAGPGAVEKFKGIPPYLETRQYVVKVLTEYKKQREANAPVQSVHQ